MSPKSWLSLREYAVEPTIMKRTIETRFPFRAGHRSKKTTFLNSTEPMVQNLTHYILREGWKMVTKSPPFLHEQ